VVCFAIFISISMSLSSLQPESPCVGRCSTTYGDDICKGCGRTFLEVINWIVLSDEEKAAIRARLQQQAISR
jgi:predicted Fe-S protein YdhL (DUF1289 family)